MADRVFYFGCIGDTGHFLFDASGCYVRPDRVGVPFSRGGLDQRDPPGRKQEQGNARLSFESGWTLLHFWDRTVDRRPGSHSIFLVEGGPHSGDVMMQRAERAFPKVLTRIIAAGPIEIVEDLCIEATP